MDCARVGVVFNQEPIIPSKKIEADQKLMPLPPLVNDYFPEESELKMKKPSACSHKQLREAHPGHSPLFSFPAFSANRVSGMDATAYPVKGQMNCK